MYASGRRRAIAAGCILCALTVFVLVADAQPSPPGLSNKGPLSPREALATFRLPRGLHLELAACEPDVVDPVAMTFDDQGRLFVAEMRGYPNAGVGTGTITSGRIQCLEDRNGDGSFEHATLFAEGLRFPMSVLPWRDGLLVAVAPEILFLRDTDGDGKADQKQILYTGFDQGNIQQLVNSLHWGLDNWVHGVAGNAGGSVRSAEKPDQPPVVLRGRGFRFRPDVPGSLEPTSGGGQYGLTADTWGRWFTATNSQHLRHIVLPDHALQRNPQLPVRAVTLDIPDHGAACRVFRLSPFEAWRVERTRRRKEGGDAARFPTTELVPGGFSTSACSPLVIDSPLWPAEYRGSVLVCDPANNLIHRDVLVANGATFTARRGEADCEFLASTDNWFRPVWLTLGPDGAIYVLDFYREVIETPLSLPEDIKARVNLQSRERGRIWRITSAEKPRRQVLALRQQSSDRLVQHLASPHIWWRTTAQRLLVERRDAKAIPALSALAEADSAVGRAHALWTLEGLNALSDALIVRALGDAEAGVREQALQLAELRLARAPGLVKAVCNGASDSSPRVRFQTALTLGASQAPERQSALAAILRHPQTDTWTETAVFTAIGKQATPLLRALVEDNDFRQGSVERQRQTLAPVATLVGASASEAELRELLGLLAVPSGKPPANWQLVLLEGLGAGLRQSNRSLAQLLARPAPETTIALSAIRVADELLSRDGPLPERLTAVGILGYVPFAQAEPALKRLLSPQQPAELQLSAVRALSLQEDPKATSLLLANWGGYTPTIRREALEALFARPERLQALLSALEDRTILANQLDAGRLEMLRTHRNPTIRARAQKVLANRSPAEREKVIQAFKPALELKGDRGRGQKIFRASCVACHRLENQGHEVGADLLAALKNKTAEQLLLDILDPSREVDPRYQNYAITTKRGQTLSGVIATETASSITLRRGEKVEDQVLRPQIEEMIATGKSLMPDGLEAQWTPQDFADLLNYLLGVTR